ncbi:hypothetical protein [Streptomyces sp. F-1]|uniref:hypothetical protein n=1 Tax=Streptomyces sp. F-1 TaxID=463642 RepID=UPI00085BDD2C|nr:hypothetical protein [Streptomyces sp. F-1]SFY52085.1 hypothetical protein STEPF1_05354 [Streptomyces sp. F-1]
MTPAEEIKQAATRLRELATAAADNSGSSNWHTTRHFPDQPDSTFTSLWATGVRPLLGGAGGRGRPPAYVKAPVGDYIAAMDPAVGLALADWLETTAAKLNHSTHPGWQDHVEPHALAVARAINAQP